MGSDDGNELTYEECEANRHDLAWGDPVEQLGLHAAHWLESAYAHHPERRAELDALMQRLEEATGNVSAEDDAEGWVTGTATDGEIVVSLERIVAIMKELAPLLMDPTQNQ